MNNSVQDSYEIKGLSQTLSLLKHFQNSCFPEKTTVMLSYTLSLSIFLGLLKSVSLDFFCIFTPNAVYNVAKYYTSCIIFFVTSLVLLQSMHRREASLEEHLVQRLHVSHMLTVISSQRQCIILKQTKQHLRRNDQHILMVPISIKILCFSSMLEPRLQYFCSHTVVVQTGLLHCAFGLRKKRSQCLSPCAYKMALSLSSSL